MFYRTGIRSIDDCLEPALPDDVGYLIVAYGPDYAIADTAYLGAECQDGVEPVPEGLGRLLSSSQDYPPARALAMEYCENLKLDYPSLCDHLERLLLQRNLSQPTDGFRFLRAAGDQIGYMNRSQFYWVLGYVGDLVYWVSSDYQIYKDHCSCFGLTGTQLAEMFPNPWTRPLRYAKG